MSTIFDLIKNGDNYGIELLYTHHYRFLFSTAFSILSNEEDSKEVVQEVMLKLIKLKRESFPKTGELSWLYKVIQNECYSLLRRERRNISIDDMPEIPIIDKDISDFVDMDTYYSLIDGLNEKQKQIVTLKVLGGLSHKEIAKALNKPIGTVQWLYNTSIKQLRVALVSLASLILVLTISLFSLTLYIEIPPNYEVESSLDIMEESATASEESATTSEESTTTSEESTAADENTIQEDIATEDVTDKDATDEDISDLDLNFIQIILSVILLVCIMFTIKIWNQEK